MYGSRCAINLIARVCVVTAEVEDGWTSRFFIDDGKHALAYIYEITSGNDLIMHNCVDEDSRAPIVASVTAATIDVAWRIEIT